MWPFKNKFQKLQRGDVVEAICQLEKESADIEESLVGSEKHIDDLMKRGRAEKNKDLKLLWAKKINFIKQERQEQVRRMMYIMYNIQMLNKLKRAIDDNQFFAKTSAMSLGNLLKDQKGLAVFLNKALRTRVAAEDVLTGADEAFKLIEDSYQENESIYGVGQEDDALLAMFETEEQVAGEQEMFAEHAKAQPNTSEEQ